MSVFPLRYRAFPGLPGRKNTGLSRSELRPVNAGQAAQWRGRLGRGILVSTTQPRPVGVCWIGTNLWSQPTRWSVELECSNRTVRERFACCGGRSHHHRPARHRDQASHVAARAGSGIMPTLHRISTPAPPESMGKVGAGPCHHHRKEHANGRESPNARSHRRIRILHIRLTAPWRSGWKRPRSHRRGLPCRRMRGRASAGAIGRPDRMELDR